MSNMVKLGEICVELSDGLHAAPEFDPLGEYLFVNANNMVNGRIVDIGNGKRASKIEYEKYKIELDEQTLFYSIDGTIGNVAKYHGEKCILGKGACYLRLKPEISRDYIYYLLQSDSFKGYIQTMKTGSTIHHISLDTMRNFRFSLPNIEDQEKKVAAVSIIDSKISINMDICKELEDLAKTVYDYWFTQFDFPNAEGKPYRASGGEMVWNDQLKREIPKGWTAADIKTVCEIVDCLHSKKPCEKFESEEFFLLTLENLTKDGYIDLSEKYYISQNDYSEWTSRIEVRENDFVVTNAGRAGDIGKIPKGVRCAIGRNLTAIRPVAIDPYYLRGFFRSGYVQQQIKTNLDSGSLFKSFNVKSINKLVILIPDKSTLNAYLEIAVPIVKMIEEKLSENQILQSLRDWLLPMLMNGQATVE